MQTKCFIFDVGELEKEEAFAEAYAALFYADRKAKIDALLRQEDKNLSLGVGLLIEYAFRQNGVGYPAISLSKKGKPMIKEGCFNAAHSGNLAVVAFSQKPVGVDVEKMRPVSHLVKDKFFTEEEQTLACTEEAFFRLWTKKESYTKFLGDGIGALRTFEISTSSPINQEVDFYEKAWQGHQICVCTQKGEEVDFIQVDLAALLQR